MYNYFYNILNVKSKVEYENYLYIHLIFYFTLNNNNIFDVTYIIYIKLCLPLRPVQLYIHKK